MTFLMSVLAAGIGYCIALLLMHGVAKVLTLIAKGMDAERKP